MDCPGAMKPEGGKLAILSAVTGEEIRGFVAHTPWTGDAQFSRDGSRLFTVGADRTMRVWDTHNWAECISVPIPFAPKLLGCDPVILRETDRAVAGDIQYGAFFDGELYLFKTDERRKQFKSQPDKFIRLQHALKIDQVERTAMR